MATKRNRLAKGFNLPKVKNKTIVDDKDAEVFLAGMPKKVEPLKPSLKPLASSSQRSKTLPAKKRVSKEKETPLSTSSGSDSKLRRAVRGERVAAYIPPELAEKLRVRCAMERRSVSDAVTAAVASWLNS